MEQLLDLQNQTGETIQTIVRNFKKDTADRKGKAGYFEERLRRLQESWNQFQETDSKIRDVCEEPMKLEYFSNDYYEKIKRVASEYIELFEKEATRLKQNPITESLIHGRHKPLSEVPSNACGIIRKLDAKLSAFIRLLHGVIITEDQPLQHFELKIETIKRSWEQIETLHSEAHETLTDPVANGLDQDLYNKTFDQMHQVLVNLSVKADQMRCVAPTQNGVAPVSNIGSSIQLPKLTIPKFDGNYLNGANFTIYFLKW